MTPLNAKSVWCVLITLSAIALTPGANGSTRSSTHYAFARESFDSVRGQSRSEDTLVTASLDWLGNTPVVSASYSLVSHRKPSPFNTPPIAHAGAEQIVEATGQSGASVVLNGSGSSEPDGDSLTFAWSGPFGTASGPEPTVTLPLGSSTVNLTVEDTEGAIATASVIMQVRDTTPPQLLLPADTVVEAVDPAGTILTFSPKAEDLVAGPVDVTASPASGSVFPLGENIVTCSATDPYGNRANMTFAITVVDSYPPLVTNVVVTPNPVPLNTPILLTALAGDPEAGGSSIVAAQCTLDGVNCLPMQASDGDFDECSEEITAIHPPFETPGVYALQVCAWDAQGNAGASESMFVPVYDPSSGFVTGGGWIWSPAEAFHPDLEDFANLTGKATFGFVAKYQKGANVPTGNTEFQFKAGELHFKSTVYQWLVVAGARAQFKGWGSVNDIEGFGFMLTGIDGALLGGSPPDRFRIKIWDMGTDTVIYDNQAGTDDNGDLTTDGTLVQGGSVVVHKK